MIELRTQEKLFSETCSTILRSRWNRLLIAASLLSGVANAQLGGFGCPIAGKPAIRQGDAVAASGGRFNSGRAAGSKHGGLDLNSTVGTSVMAALEGRAAVAQKGWGHMGHTVILDHGAGAYTVYGHLDSVDVIEGALVTKGQKLGTVGYSGNAAALKTAELPPHLHFALIQAGQTGLADLGKPLRKMRDWADYWKGLDIQLTGPVNPGLFGMSDCWTGSTTVGAPGEK